MGVTAHSSIEREKERERLVGPTEDSEAISFDREKPYSKLPHSELTQ